MREKLRVLDYVKKRVVMQRLSILWLSRVKLRQSIEKPRIAKII